jgi:hypothetical protein
MKKELFFESAELQIYRVEHKFELYKLGRKEIVFYSKKAMETYFNLEMQNEWLSSRYEKIKKEKDGLEKKLKLEMKEEYDLLMSKKKRLGKVLDDLKDSIDSFDY